MFQLLEMIVLDKETSNLGSGNQYFMLETGIVDLEQTFSQGPAL